MPLDLSGGWVWLWNLNNQYGSSDGGDIAAIAARIKENGGRGVIFKITDGAEEYYQSPDYTPAEAVKAFQDAGLDVGTWSYHYGGALGEANAILGVFSKCTPSFHCIDGEKEVEDSSDPVGWAHSLTATLRGSSSVPLVYSPLPIIHYHTRFPYYQLSVEAQLPMIPQLYYVGLEMTPNDTVEQFTADMDTYSLTGPELLPSYEDAPLAEPSAGSTDADAATFGLLCQAQNWTGVAVWAYEHMDAPAWQRFARMVQVLAPTPTPTPDPTPTPTPTPPTPGEPQRIQYAQIGAGITATALDPALSDEEALTTLLDMAVDIYNLTWPSSAFNPVTQRLDSLGLNYDDVRRSLERMIMPTPKAKQALEELGIHEPYSTSSPTNAQEGQ